jgi:hypothetical protein
LVTQSSKGVVLNLLKGLFNSKKNTSYKSSIPEFKDIMVETTSVEKELQKVSKRYGIALKELDFSIISYKSYFKLSNESKKYRLLKDIDEGEVLTQENLLNPEFSLKQQYKVNIFKKNSSSNYPIKIVLGANSDFTRVVATFKKNPTINYHDRLFNDISNQINKKKLKQGLLIGVMNSEIKKNINKVVSHIMINKSIKEDIKIVLCEGIQRVNQSGGIVILHYKEQNELIRTTSLNLKQQSNVDIVKKEDIVIEAVKPQVGSDGRSCKGEFLTKNSNKNIGDLTLEDISHSENIIRKELEDRVYFIAAQDGYVYVDKNYFDIRDEIDIDQVNLKTTGSISSDNNIKLNIQNSDELSDAIGSGITLETKEIKTKGNVGSNAQIKADTIEIEGQTHQNSVVEGDYVKVRLHKGSIKGKKVYIDTLESGSVIADEIHVETLSGGTIQAQKIYIQKLISNAHISASELIEIDEISGSSNKIIIDPKAQVGYERVVTDIQDKIVELNRQIKDNTKNLNKIKRKIVDDRDIIEEVKKRVLEMKSANQKPPFTMTNKLKMDKENKLTFNKYVTLIKDLKEQQEESHQKIKKFEESIFDARVILHSPWVEFNDIIFKMNEPKLELTRVSKDGEISPIIGLKVTKDKEYIIANLDD